MNADLVLGWWCRERVVLFGLVATVVLFSCWAAVPVAQARVVTLASGSEAGTPRLAMNRAGAFAIAWQPTDDSVSVVRGSSARKLAAVAPHRLRHKDGVDDLSIALG